jgi:hypothetical protein
VATVTASVLPLSFRKHSSPPFKINPSTTQDLRRRTEIMPVKDSHTRIKPLPLAWPATAVTRYTAVINRPERALVSVGEWALYIAVINL